MIGEGSLGWWSGEEKGRRLLVVSFRSGLARRQRLSLARRREMTSCGLLGLLGIRGERESGPCTFGRWLQRRRHRAETGPLDEDCQQGVQVFNCRIIIPTGIA